MLKHFIYEEQRNKHWARICSTLWQMEFLSFSLISLGKLWPEVQGLVSASKWGERQVQGQRPGEEWPE